MTITNGGTASEGSTTRRSRTNNGRRPSRRRNRVERERKPDLLDNFDNAGRRPKATPKQLIGLLRLRVGALAACVGRIEGIEQRLHEFGIRLPRSMMPPLPDVDELRNAESKLLNKLWEWPEKKRRASDA